MSALLVISVLVVVLAAFGVVCFVTNKVGAGSVRLRTSVLEVFTLNFEVTAPKSDAEEAPPEIPPRSDDSDDDASPP